MIQFQMMVVVLQQANNPTSQQKAFLFLRTPQDIFMHIYGNRSRPLSDALHP